MLDERAYLAELAAPTAPAWELHHAELSAVLPSLPDDAVDVIIADPPYSEHVHKSVRSARRREVTDGAGRLDGCATRRTVDLGFTSLGAPLRRFCAREFARLARRWVVVFGDDRTAHWWRLSLEGAGLDFVRMLAWVRIGGAPQFSGDRPASGVEWMVLAHRPGRKRWNGGGKAGVYIHPIVANRNGHRSDRVHETQKPEALMLGLVDDFTEPGELVLDPFAGSGTTGVAALRRGRRFLGVERLEKHAETARARLEAESSGLTLAAYRGGQLPMFPRGGQ